MFKRISVIGMSGSGKSTLSEAISKVKDLPRLELDRAFWRENWTNASDEELGRIVADFASQDSWVIDGNYTRIQKHIQPRADLILSMEIPFWLNLWRVTLRSIYRAYTRRELWAGNRESLSRMFSKESIILWVWNNWHSRRDATRTLFRALVHEKHPTSRAIPLQLSGTNERKIFLSTLASSKGITRKALIYPTSDERILVFEHPITGLVEPVRGTVDPNETARTTAIRELAEETGFELSDEEKSRVRRFAVKGRVLKSGADLRGPPEYRIEEVFTVDVDASRKPSSWIHQVSGGGLDDKMKFKVFWLPLHEAMRRLTPLTAEFIGELFEFRATKY